MRKLSAIVLIVEDNPADVELLREAWVEADLRHELRVAPDGETALRFLRRQEEHAQAPRPDLILLDLNLPRMTGQEVLAAVKTDEGLRSIPVVVLTSSDAVSDIERCYGLHANSYLSKPVDIDRFVEMMRALDAYWFWAATRPPR